jgi:hypothetical protein
MKNLMRFLMIAILLATVLNSCKKDPTDPPAVTTTEVTSITGTSAASGGEVTSEGSSIVTERGICWGTAANPTITDSKTSDGTGLGVFTSSITGLAPGTVYHARAYATNSHGTSYGADVEFSTSFLVKSISFYALWAGGTEMWEFTYDGTTKKVTKFDNYWEGVLDKEIVYDYSTPGKLFLEYANGDPYREYDINAQGYITKDYDSGNTYVYDTNGFLIEVYEYWDSADHLKYKMTITDGNIAKITTYDDDAVTEKKIKEYTYTIGDNVNGLHQANITDSEWKPTGNFYGKASAKLVDFFEFWDPREAGFVKKKATLAYEFDTKNRPSKTTKTRTGADDEVLIYTYYE